MKIDAYQREIERLRGHMYKADEKLRALMADKRRLIEDNGKLKARIRELETELESRTTRQIEPEKESADYEF